MNPTPDKTLAKYVRNICNIQINILAPSICKNDEIF
jgi:hypothetical protein